MSNEIKCLACQTKTYGRIDKKFCSDYCRSGHHNKQNADSNSLIRKINYNLRKNRRILQKLNPKGKSKTTKSVLLGFGFNFNYYTNEYKSRAGKIYKFCYEQGYTELEDGRFVLIKRELSG